MANGSVAAAEGYRDVSMSVYQHGGLGEVLRTNIWDGQIPKWTFMVKSGRLLQAAGLMLWGIVLGRTGFFRRLPTDGRVNLTLLIAALLTVAMLDLLAKAAREPCPQQGNELQNCTWGHRTRVGATSHDPRVGCGDLHGMASLRPDSATTVFVRWPNNLVILCVAVAHLCAAILSFRRRAGRSVEPDIPVGWRCGWVPVAALDSHNLVQAFCLWAPRMDMARIDPRPDGHPVPSSGANKDARRHGLIPRSSAPTRLQLALRDKRSLG